MGKKWSKQAFSQPGCWVLHIKSFCSSFHTCSAAATYTKILKRKTTESQMRPMTVEYLFTPLRMFSRKPQFIFLSPVRTFVIFVFIKLFCKSQVSVKYWL